MMFNEQTRVFLASASFDRTYGGIAICVARLAKELHMMGVPVSLWAPDGSAVSSDVVDEDFPQASRLTGPPEEALERTHRPDIIHDNGIWLPHNHSLATLSGTMGIPRVVSIHGMLEPWAMKHRRLKKLAAWHLYQKRDLNSAHLIHATATSERAAINRMRLLSRQVVIPNGTDLPETDATKNYSKDERVMLFLSRIHPKKGLPMLLEAWAQLKPGNWCLKIAGPDEDGHLGEVVSLVEKYNLSSVVSFLGALDGVEVTKAYRESDVFVLPTHSENFGLVVTEALAHDLPVLTTTAAPWAELNEEDCGWSVPPTVDGIATGLEHVFKTTNDELRQKGERGKALVKRKYAWSSVAERFIEAYRTIQLDAQAAI